MDFDSHKSVQTVTKKVRQSSNRRGSGSEIVRI